MQKINCALIGFGTIGSGVVKLFNDNTRMIMERTDIDIRLKYIVDIDIDRDRGVDVSSYILTRDYKEVINDKDIDIIIELVGGTGVAYDIVKGALQSGKNVVTANKALLFAYGDELFSLAREKGLLIGFEASVGGGIPIIRTIKEGLVADKINSIHAIINGTTNYILTKMHEDKLEFKKALKDAQEKGFAEADPTLDINGHDAQHKIAILARLAFGLSVKEEDIYCEGIENIELDDIKYGDELGFVLKLLAIATRDNEGISVRVHPSFIPKKHALASVRNEYNAVMIDSNFLGMSMYVGKGAGSYPTASAVVANIVDVAYWIVNETKHYPAYMNGSKDAYVKSFNDIENRYYMRFTTVDQPGVLHKISGILAQNNISIAGVIQKESKENVVPVIITTHNASEKAISSAISKIDELDVVRAKTKLIRIVC